MKVSDVTSTEIAIDDPSGPRGFALNVSVANPQGQVDGPVETRYSIDPNASANGTTQATANATTESMATESPPSNATASGTARSVGVSEGTRETTGMTGSGADTSATERTGSRPGANATDTQSTGTSGPGFGVVVGIVALLTVALFVMRRR